MHQMRGEPPFYSDHLYYNKNAMSIPVISHTGGKAHSPLDQDSFFAFLPCHLAAVQEIKKLDHL
ncbi:Uncharacterized protein dnm_046030 [Desulfonema magnum]|uniref:Uncharacterized protein n=1 Tax=Desulfonema magnum TaxID=45655 RepID=A0A975GP19_9BACT|nr:Uncharacterized protein dnm_046030 [Desulfonema magnum]